MTMRLVAAMILIGCNSGQGVDIEIHSDKPLTAVELWLGYDNCHLADGVTNCTGIVWPGGSTTTAGKVLTLGADEKVFRTEVIVDGVAQLHLEASAEDSQPISIAVVGFSGTDVVSAQLIKHVEIPVNDQVHWQVDLDAASPMATANITANPGSGPIRNAMVWARKPSSTLRDTTGYSGCLAHQKWNGVEWETTYFVPSSDTDCDGDPPDCNPYWYEAPVGTSRCVTGAPLAPSVCAVGSLACSSETDRNACVAQTPPTGPLICVGSAACTACADSPDLAACLKDLVTTNTSSTPLPLQRCPMYVTQDGPCVNNTSGTAGWQARFFIKGGACAPPAANADIVNIRLPMAPFSGGSTTMTLTGGASIAAHATPSGTGCTIDITHLSGSQPMGFVPITLGVFYGPGRELVFPVLLDFELQSVCPTPNGVVASCLTLGAWPETGQGDSMFSCTTGP